VSKATTERYSCGKKKSQQPVPSSRGERRTTRKNRMGGDGEVQGEGGISTGEGGLKQILEKRNNDRKKGKPSAE